MWTREWSPATWSTGLASAPAISEVCSAGRLAAARWAEAGGRSAPPVLARTPRSSSLCAGTARTSSMSAPSSLIFVSTVAAGTHSSPSSVTVSRALLSTRPASGQSVSLVFYYSAINKKHSTTTDFYELYLIIHRHFPLIILDLKNFTPPWTIKHPSL